ncbi:MAG: hypothetical protein LBM65_01350 [Oscillospiraceae bacterium]|jgi:ribosomal protein L37AE/L43A|nr:hypothetical protein [Oscillospiraceae bacterium]
MGKSSRILGNEYGLSAQEMNYILKKEGFLSGEPGDYSVTEKGAEFANERDFHRGTGGYSHYNRYWTTRSWDDSIESELDITDDLKNEAKNAVFESRKRQWDEIKAARQEADAKFLASQNNITEPYENAEENDELILDGKTALGGAVIIGGLLAIGYGVYKAVPHIVKWWNERRQRPTTTLATTSTKTVKKQKNMLCPSCGATMSLNDDGIWLCECCKYSITNKELENNYVFWFCDKCETFLNNQHDFSLNESVWVCTKCGHENDVTENNID